jgi:alkylation response protein AidB-like acyl-CoA dehydrogenase
VDHVVYILFKLFKGYSVCRKCYPVVFGSVAWYTSGIEWEEVWDLMEYHHLENKKKYKKIVTDYRVGKDKAAKAAAEAEAAKAAAEAEAAKADAEAEAPKADAEAEAAKADAEAEVADAAKPDEEAKASARKWYFLWLM